MNPAWLDLQARCDALVREWRDGCVIDLTMTGVLNTTPDWLALQWACDRLLAVIDLTDNDEELACV